MLVMGVGGEMCTAWWRRMDGHLHTSIYQLVMVFEDEGSLLRLLVFETPVTREEMALFGPVEM